MKRELICIVCPIGCHMEIDDSDGFKVTGNQCPRGPVYAKEELTAPKRVITSTIKINGGIHKVVPVKTDGGIPKELNFECMKVISKLEVQAPVRMGQIVIENILDTGINLVITRDM
jgi:CxxC motif-containing protein